MSRIFQAISGIFSFETLFILYVFAGQYKKEEMFSQLNSLPDLTSLLFVASVAVGVFIFIVKKMEIKRESCYLSLIFLLFICYAGFSLSWSNSSEYGLTKTMYLGCQNFWNLIAAAFIIAPDEKRLRRFMFGIFLFSLIYVGMSITFLIDASTKGPIAFEGTNYDGIALVICTGIMVIMFYIIDPLQNKLAKITNLILCCIYFTILLFVGDRGYFIATVLAVFLLLFLHPTNPISSKNNTGISKGYFLLLIMFWLAIIIIIPLSGREPVTLSRLVLLSAPSKHGSSLNRLIYYKDAFIMWSQHPIWGCGIGSFPIREGWGDMRLYPHNFILEILAELGLVGLLIFGFFLFYAVKMLLKNLFINYPLSLFVLLLFVVNFIDLFIGGDISDHRLLMVSLGLMMVQQKTSQGSESYQAGVLVLPELNQVALKSRC
jgi:O-antigen ligase